MPISRWRIFEDSLILDVFLRHFIKLDMMKKYVDKTNKKVDKKEGLSHFKCSLTSRINKLKYIATELGSKPGYS